MPEDNKQTKDAEAQQLRDMEEVTGLWMKVGAKGPYLSGRSKSGDRYFVFKSRAKNPNSRTPTHTLMVIRANPDESDDTGDDFFSP